jgi:hypothetical protein
MPSFNGPSDPYEDADRVPVAFNNWHSARLWARAALAKAGAL